MNKTRKCNVTEEEISGSVLEETNYKFKDMKECLQTVHRSFYPWAKTLQYV